MQIETLTYTPDTLWSHESFPALDSPQTLVLVFGAPQFLNDTAPIQTLISAYPQSLIAGCSTAGEIHQDLILDQSLSVAVIQFEKTQLKQATVTIEDNSLSTDAGKTLAKVLLQDDLKYVLVLSDGLKVNGTELVNGLSAGLPQDVQISGGLAGDNDKFEQTWVISEGKPQSGVIQAIGFYGDAIEMGYGSQGGWDVFGPTRTITRSEGNVIYEIDGQPALTLYKTYLGDRANELPASALLFPLAISEEPNTDNKIVRTILAVDEDAQSMTFAGDMPEGWSAQLMKANFERLIDGAANASLTSNNENGSPVLAIAISCVGRRLVLGERTEEEVEATIEHLPPSSKQVGFYSYGEISPSGYEHCNLHNQTMTITTLREK